jgi:hypothetical protein
MKKSTIVWAVLAGLALVALGFAAGFLINRGGMGVVGAVGPRRIMAFGGFPIMAGLGFLARLVFCLGPLAGIIALIIVLTRRDPASPAPAQAVPVTGGTTAAAVNDPSATAAGESTPPMPIKRRK